MQEIIDGVLKFQREAFPQRSGLFKELSTAQKPKALFIACSDSRVVPELLTQQEPGDLFVIRNAGNIVPANGPQPGGVTASVEYAVSVLGVTDIIICGHSDCGAMTAIASDADMGHLPAVAGWLAHADAAKAVNAARTHASDSERLDGMVRGNVLAQLNNIKTHPSVSLALDQHRVTLHGWVYDIETGSIDTLDGASGNFVSLAQNPGASATAGAAQSSVTQSSAAPATATPAA